MRQSESNGRANPVLCEVERAQRLESRHRGVYVVVDETGIVRGAGQLEQPVFPRSSLKPLQLLPLFSSGAPDRLQMTREERACLCASHSSDEGHIESVRRILAKAEIPEDALGCGPHNPIDQEATKRLFARGETPTPIHNNCSGKHSGFLIRAKELGAPLEGYLDPRHPVQVEVRDTLNELGDLALGPEDAGYDGCGAPMYPFPIARLARIVMSIANPELLPDRLREGARQVFHAFVDSPHYIAGYREPGQTRLDTVLLEAGAGRIFGKCGAEGCFAIGVRRGPEQPALGIAVKIDDGNGRAYETFLPRLLIDLGILSGTEEPLQPFLSAIVKNTQGREVGVRRALLTDEHGRRS